MACGWPSLRYHTTDRVGSKENNYIAASQTLGYRQSNCDAIQEDLSHSLCSASGYWWICGRWPNVDRIPVLRIGWLRSNFFIFLKIYREGLGLSPMSFAFYASFCP